MSRFAFESYCVVQAGLVRRGTPPNKIGGENEVLLSSVVRIDGSPFTDAEPLRQFINKTARLWCQEYEMVSSRVYGAERTPAAAMIEYRDTLARESAKTGGEATS